MIRIYTKKYNDLRGDFYDLLSAPNFIDISGDLESFTFGETKEAVFMGQFHNENKNIDFTLDTKGFISSLVSHIQTIPLIEFAYSQPHFTFTQMRAEVIGNQNILSMTRQNLRELYWKLTDSQKTNIIEIMNTFCQINKIERGYSYSLCLTETNGITLEISLCRSSIQKIFALEILFQSLISKQSHERIFLIEEPEAFLSPSTSLKYFQSLSCRAKQNFVQLIVTSNSSLIIDCFPQCDQKTLYKQ
jgi:hypothetical protein